MLQLLNTFPQEKIVKYIIAAVVYLGSVYTAYEFGSDQMADIAANMIIESSNCTDRSKEYPSSSSPKSDRKASLRADEQVRSSGSYI